MSRGASAIHAGFVLKTHVRCEDCDLRGDMHAVGKPLAFHYSAISKCQNCTRGEIEVSGPASIDPYAKRQDDYYSRRRALKASIRRAAWEKHVRF